MRAMATRPGLVMALVVGTLVLAGCGPTTPTVNAPPPQPLTQVAAATPTPTPTPTVRDLTVGNCTMYPKASAVKLIGAVNLNNKALDIKTGGGAKIDVCSYLNLKGTDIQGISYGVVRFDSPAAAYAAAQQVRTAMLESASDHDWAVTNLTAPVPNGGPLLGGYGTKTEQGVTYTIAVVGTNVGPYTVVALGASTESVDNAKKFALDVFQALAAATG